MHKVGARIETVLCSMPGPDPLVKGVRIIHYLSWMPVRYTQDEYRSHSRAALHSYFHFGENDATGTLR